MSKLINKITELEAQLITQRCKASYDLEALEAKRAKEAQQRPIIIEVPSPVCINRLYDFNQLVKLTQTIDEWESERRISTQFSRDIKHALNRQSTREL